MNDQSGWYSAPAAIQALSVSFWAAVSCLWIDGGGIDFVVVGGEDAVDHLAFVRLAGRDGARLDGHLPPVEPQVGLSRGAVRAVAGEAVFGQDRPDVAIEAQLFGRRGNRGRKQQEQRDGPKPAGGERR